MSCTKNSYLDSKVMLKNQIFRLIVSCTKNSYLDSKVIKKKSDLQANVVTLFNDSASLQPLIKQRRSCAITLNFIHSGFSKGSVLCGGPWWILTMGLADLGNCRPELPKG